MNEKKYIKLVKKTNKLEARVKTQDELIELLTNALIEANGRIAALEEAVYEKQKNGDSAWGPLFFRAYCILYNDT